MLYRKTGTSIDTYGIDELGRIVGKDDLNGHAEEETWLAQNSLNAQLTSHWNSQLQLGYTQTATSSQLSGLENNVFTRFVSGLTLRASGGTGYRLPSYTELLFLFFANKNLKPERSASGDLGLEWHQLYLQR